jgi:hypothetical protein
MMTCIVFHISAAKHPSFSRHGISSFHLQVANRRDSKGIRLLLQQLKNSAKTASALAYFSAEQWRVFIP